MNTIHLAVQGMTCGSCVKHVTQALQTLNGVQQVDVDLPSGYVKVSGGAFSFDPRAVIAALDAAGYPAKQTNLAARLADKPMEGCKSSGRAKGGCCCG